MANRVQNWSLTQWEAYATRFCGNASPAGATDYVSKGICLDGRVSYLPDTDNKIIILAFRGTCNLSNAINDIWLGPRNLEYIQNIARPLGRLENVRVHRGFSDEYKGLQEQIKTILSSMVNDQNSGWRILVTGHSLGGALATICAADILLNHSAVRAGTIALVTLGSPRTGNQHFAEWIDRSGLFVNSRVEVENDPVISLPAQNGTDFWHRGRLTLLRFDADKSMYRMVAHSDTTGEINGSIRSFGNKLGAPLRWLTPFEPAIAGVTTSVAGAVIDFLARTVNGHIPFTPWVMHCEAYWQCNEYMNFYRY